eukprot:TRINITY_DN10818_c0_g1_i2.p2 TRINITY_DN10818_c0_g1~~TRINITY_DN10818_c0_g1_i2.p2  ORF type:complete len:170 (-),score=20.86 TRINITY_DN10818_c0_g1_i2:428-937(-)
MIRRPPRSTHCISSAASDVYKRQGINAEYMGLPENKDSGKKRKGNLPDKSVRQSLSMKQKQLLLLQKYLDYLPQEEVFASLLWFAALSCSHHRMVQAKTRPEFPVTQFCQTDEMFLYQEVIYRIDKKRPSRKMTLVCRQRRFPLCFYFLCAFSTSSISRFNSSNEISSS